MIDAREVQPRVRRKMGKCDISINFIPSHIIHCMDENISAGISQNCSYGGVG